MFVWTGTKLLVVRKHNNAVVIIHLRLDINEIVVLYQSRPPFTKVYSFQNEKKKSTREVGFHLSLKLKK